MQLFSKKVKKIKVKVLVFQKKVVSLHRVKEITRRPGPVPGKEQSNVSNAINGHLQKNASDQNVQKNVWPEILYKGRNDCQLRNSQKFNTIFPFGNRTPNCTTFKVINPGPGQPGPQFQSDMKTIVEIAKNAGFECEIDRHGCYTNYTLTKGSRALRIEYTAATKGNIKRGTSGYLFMANGPINHNIDGAENFVWETPRLAMTHALAKNGNWLYLTIEQVENLINNN